MGSGWFIKKVNHSIENLKNRRGFQIRIRNLNVCFINPLLIDIMYIIWEIIWITHIIVTRIQGTFPTVLCNKFCDFAKFRVSFQLDDFVFKVGVSFACQKNQKRQFFTKTLAFNFGCRKNPMPFFCFLIHGSFKWQSVGCFWVPRDSGIRWRWWQNNLEFSNFEWRCCCWAKGTVYDHNQSSCTWDSTPNWCAGRNNGPWRSRPFGWRSFRTRSSAGRSGDRTWKFITWFAGCWDPPFVDRIFVSPCCRSLRCWGRWFQNVAFQGSASDRTRPTSVPTNVLQQLLQWLASMLWVSHWMKITFVGLRLWSKWHRPPTRSHMSHHVLLGKSWAIETCGVISSPIQCRTTLWWTRLWNLGNGVKIGIVKRGSNERPQVL